MVHMNTESEVKFDYSVGAEERFAFRRWVKDLVDTQNTADLGMLTKFCTNDLVVLGFSEGSLSREAFVKHMEALRDSGKELVVRYPNLVVSYNRYLFDVEGTLEIFIDGILSIEGTFESRVQKNDDQFQFAWMKFYPRMSVSVFN